MYALYENMTRVTSPLVTPPVFHTEDLYGQVVTRRTVEQSLVVQGTCTEHVFRRGSLSAPTVSEDGCGVQTLSYQDQQQVNENDISIDLCVP